MNEWKGREREEEKEKNEQISHGVWGWGGTRSSQQQKHHRNMHG